MEPIVETQEKTVIEQVSDRQLQREQDIDRHFAEIDVKLANQPTKDELAVALAGLANKNDVERLNNYVHNFTLGVQVLEKSSKWILLSVITIGGLAAGLLIIKNIFVVFIGWLGFTRM